MQQFPKSQYGTFEDQESHPGNQKHDELWLWLKDAATYIKNVQFEPEQTLDGKLKCLQK